MEEDKLSIQASYIGFVAVGHGHSLPAKEMQEIPSLTQMFHELIHMPGPTLGHVFSLSGRDDAIHWHLSSGRKLNCPASSYIVQLPFGFLGVVAYCAVEEKLSVDEVIEMAALLRGTHQQLGVTLKGNVYYSNPTTSRAIAQFVWSYFAPGDAFVVPVVSAKDFVPHLETSQLILQRFSSEITSIVTLAIRRSQFIKPAFTDEILSTDTHPYTYGITIFSPTCTFEIHPQQVKIIASEKGVTLEEHHSREWSSLWGILMITAFQRASLEADSHHLDSLLDSHQNISGINLIQNLVLLQRISRQRREIARRLGIYLNVHLSQRNYIKNILQNTRRSFLLDALYQAVSSKLDHIRDDTNSLYVAYTTAIVIMLTIITTITGFVSLWFLLFGSGENTN